MAWSALCAGGLSTLSFAQISAFDGPSPNISGPAIDYDNPPVASGPVPPGVYAGTGITSITQVGTNWVTSTDLVTAGLVEGQCLVSQMGVAAIAGEGEPLDNPGAGDGWDIVLDNPADELQVAFPDQSGFTYDVELFLGGASLGVGTFSYGSSPDLVYFRATGSMFDRALITFPNGTGGVGLDTIGFGNGPGPMAPTNDECATAIAVGTGATAYDTTLATDSPESWSCGGTGGADVWFTYTAQAAFGLRVETCGITAYDSAITLYDGTCGALNELACNDDDCGLQSGIDIIPTPGTTYTIRVGGFNGAGGPGELTVTEFLSPPNDECADAEPIVAGTIPYDTTQATVSSPFACASGGGPDLWYAYTAVNCFPVTVETCGSSYDTAIEVLRGDCANLELVACNDDSCGLQSSITFSADAGETVYIRVGGWNGSNGMGMLTLTESPPPASCVETLFASNNGGSVGGVVYFDAAFTQDVSISGLNTNYGTAAGTPCGVEVYITPNTYVGATADINLWTLVATDDGTAVSAGDDNPTSIRFTEPLFVAAGSYGIALVAVDADHEYTNGNGTNETAMSADGVISLSLGGGANTPFSTQLFSPRVWNGGFCYNADIGTSICGPAVPNSTGASGEISASGSTFVCLDNLVLTASNLPADAFGYFLSSPTAGFIPNPGGSSGNLCLDGFIGRAVGGAILLSDTSGVVTIGTNLMMPSPIGISVQIQPGETWYFQYWHRDSDGMGGTTSNLTDAVEINFE